MRACNPPGPINCNDSNACTTDSCDLATGLCKNEPHVGQPCSDDNACTGTDQCNASGQCAGTPLVGCCLKDADCNDDQACTTDTCNLATKTCTNTAKNCDDGNACTVDACDPVGGACVHPPKDCDDNNPCTADACDASGACVHTTVAAGTSCSDGDACNGAETCQSGVCTGPVTTFTCDDGNPCTADTCTPTSGCVSTPVANGTACEDNNVCTLTSECRNGACAPLTAETCTSGWEPGDKSYCDPVQGCQKDPGCEEFLDGNLCHPLDPNRAPGTCQYLPTFCQADGCYTQICNPSTGQCEHDPNNPRNEICDGPLRCEVPPGGCPDSYCREVTCNFGISAPNCASQSLFFAVNYHDPSTCLLRNHDLPSTCQTAVEIPGVTSSLGCGEGYGWSFTTTDCAATQPFGPPGPCQEYVQNPTTYQVYCSYGFQVPDPNPPCCELRPKQCRASDFGLPEGTTGYTFACEPTTGDCVATQQ